MTPRRPWQSTLAQAQAAAAVTTGLLGVVVLIGWHVGAPTLSHLHPGLSNMQYIAALLFIIGGTSLWLALGVGRRQRIAALLGTVMLASGALSIVQDLLGVAPNVDLVFGFVTHFVATGDVMARMAPNTALCFVLCGLALMVRDPEGRVARPLNTALLASAAVSIAAVALFGYAAGITPAYGWGRLTRMAINTAAGFVVLGTGLLCCAWRDRPAFRTAAYALPLVVGVPALIVTVTLWQTLVIDSRREALALTRAEAMLMRSAITQPIEGQRLALERMARRWQVRPPSYDEWANDASLYRADFAGYDAIVWLPGGSEAPWVVTGKEGLPAREQAWRDAIGDPWPDRQTVVAPASIREGGTELLVVAPVYHDDTYTGAIVGVIQLTTFLDTIVASWNGYEVAIFDGDTRLYGPERVDSASRPAVINANLDLAKLPWRLRVWPTEGQLAQLESSIPLVVLISGLLLTATLTAATYFAATAGQQAERLRQQVIEREAAEAALGASEARYRSLVETADDIIYRTDALGYFVFVNPTASRIMERPPSELVGLHYLELIEPSSRNEVARYYGDQVTQRLAHSYLEFPAMTPGGRRVWIGQNVHLLVEGDQVTGFQAVARDITERRRTDAELAAARDAALESDRAKSQFVANMSHELRTPMNGILGMTELLLETPLSPEQRDYATTARACGEALLGLVGDILDLSKVEAGRLELQSLDFEPRRLIVQSAEMFGDGARRKGVELLTIVHHDVPDVLVGDAGRLRQVLGNLIGNAAKFTGTGSITVRMSLAGEHASGPILRTEVTDTGIGVSPEGQARLFQPFVQADGSITRRYGGTGLGLVISRQLVELMGGRLEMTSVEGQGSTFSFTVNVGRGTLSPPRPASDQQLYGRRVLVVDDADASRQRLVEMLEGWQLAPASAVSGEDGLNALSAARARNEPFDIVVVDLRGLGMDSFEFTAAVSADVANSATRIVMLCGTGHPGDARRAEELGASAYLYKPVRPSQLFDCLVTVLDRAGDPADGTPGLVTRHTLSRPLPTGEPLLVVEDNPVNQKVLLGFLQTLGFTADVAWNGREALAALARRSYSVVFMDLHMPELDGLATAAAIRGGDAATRGTTLVAVTANAMAGERERCLAAGFDDYMSKPFSLARLTELLESCLGSGTRPVVAATLAGAPTADDGLDHEVLDGLREMDRDAPGLFAEVIGLFQRDTPTRLDGLDAAIRSGDVKQVEARAHGLKGSAGSVGAARFATHCREIEAAAAAGRLDGCAERLAEASAEFDRVGPLLVRAAGLEVAAAPD